MRFRAIVTAAALPLLTAGTLLSTTDAANATTQNNGLNSTTLNARYLVSHQDRLEVAVGVGASRLVVELLQLRQERQACGLVLGTPQVAAHQALDFADVILKLDVDCHGLILAERARLRASEQDLLAVRESAIRGGIWQRAARSER
jgi:hypothetical protein